jgi:lipoprotein NlpD
MAPVSERSLNVPRPASQSAKPAVAGYYRVQPGDTLYSIAWRYRKDYRALARANDIGRSYRIYAGQLLRLAEAPATKRSAKTQTQPVAKPSKTAPSKTAASKTAASKPAASKSTASKSKSSRTIPTQAPAAAVSAPIQWRWPANGRVIDRFSAKGKQNKGLNIAGKRGDPVFSAAAGRVVYAGNGLLGYGNLIIINHNDSYLSAYAHNKKLLVKEQERVSGGQKIAEIGNSGAAQTMLHFEIRKEGKPVDPGRYLPRR